jgi:hypothetical protein
MRHAIQDREDGIVKPIPAEDAKALRYADLLGHTVILVASATDGTRHVARASLEARPRLDGQRPVIYRRTPRGWRRVT